MQLPHLKSLIGDWPARCLVKFVLRNKLLQLYFEVLKQTGDFYL